MQTFYNSMKAIILFLVIILLAQSFVSDKFAQNMAMMILFSMIILNSDKVANFLSDVTSDL